MDISKNEQQTGSANKKTASSMETPVTKKKLDVKRVKQKVDLNSSKLNKTAATPKNFNSFGFLNMSIQKQTLRANNKALAQTLAKTKQELRHTNNLVHELKSEKQELQLSLNRLQRLVGLKDEEIEVEVKKRMREQIDIFDNMVEELTQTMFNSGKCLTELRNKCIDMRRQNSRPSTDRTSCDSAVSPSDQPVNNVIQAKRGSLFGVKRGTLSQVSKNQVEGLSPTMPGLGTSSVQHTDISIIAEQSVLADPDDNTVESLPSVMEMLPESQSTTASKGTQRKTFELPQRVRKKDKISKAEGRKSDETEKPSGNTTQVPENEVDLLGSGDLFGFGEESVVLVSGSPIKESVTRGETKKQDKKALAVPKVVVSPVDGATRSKDIEKTISKDKNGQKNISSEKTKSSSKSTTGKSVASMKNKSKKIITPPGEKKRKDTYTTTNPFKPQSTRVLRSPIRTTESRTADLQASHPEGPSKSEPTVDPINPFKPTKTLLRSPISGMKRRSHDQTNSPIQKINSQDFFAKLAENLDNSNCHAEPLPEPVFADEPTIFLNSDMELTSVIDVTRLTAQANKKSPLVPMTDVAETVEAEGQKKSKEKDQAKATTAPRKSQENETTSSKAAEASDAAVEMRNLKPGIFTFKVSRKEADGSRKPVPEKVSRARSKKKPKVVEEEVTERRAPVEDRDMFNFGDRTPTVPLEKLTKPTNNVYDVSMNESVAAPKVSLTSFREKMKETEKTKTGPSLAPPQESSKDGDVIYYMPLKDSSDDLPTKKTSRSRSKSRKHDSSDEEDWVPGQRSKSKTRSKVKRKVSSDTENEDNEKSESSKPSPRKRSKSGNTDESPVKAARRSGRSRSRPRQQNMDKDEEIVKNKPEEDKNTEKKRDNLDPNDIGRQSSRSKSKSRKITISDSEDEDFVEKIERRSRPKSRAGVDKPVEPLSRSARSRSRHRKMDVSEDESSLRLKEKDKGSPEMVIRRSARSKSRPRTLVDEDKDTAEDSTGISAISSADLAGVPWNGTPAKSSEEIPVTKSTQRSHDSASLKSKEKTAKNITDHKSIESDSSSKENIESEQELCTYQIPLKGSPKEKTVKEKSTRSRSRSRARVNDSDEAAVSKSRSKSKSRKKSVEKDDVEIDCSKVIVETKRSRRDTYVAEKSEETGLVLPVSDTDNDSVSLKSKAKTAKNNTDYKSIESDSSSKENIESEQESCTYQIPLNGSPKEKTVKEKSTRSRSRSRVRVIVSDEAAVSKSRSKSKSRRKSVDKDDIENDSGKVINKTKHSRRDTYVAEKSEETGLVLPVFDIVSFETDDIGNCEKDEIDSHKENVYISEDFLHDKENDIKIEDDFITHSRRKTTDRRRTLKTPKQYSAEKFKMPNSKSVKSQQTGDVKKTKSKTRSKSVKKQKAEVEEANTPRLENKSSQETGENSRKRLDQAFSSDTNKCTEPEKTPQQSVTKASTSKSASSKSKSTKKRKNDQGFSDKNEENATPVTTLSKLKRQLSMIHTRDSMVSEVRVSLDKLPMSDRMSTDNIDCDDSSDAKRTRRNKTQISYCPKPLNAKLRQGDAMFETKMSKENAEKARLMLTKKVTIKK